MNRPESKADAALHWLLFAVTGMAVVFMICAGFCGGFLDRDFMGHTVPPPSRLPLATVDAKILQDLNSGILKDCPLDPEQTFTRSTGSVLMVAARLSCLAVGNAVGAWFVDSGVYLPANEAAAKSNPWSQVAWDKRHEWRRKLPIYEAEQLAADVEVKLVQPDRD